MKVSFDRTADLDESNPFKGGSYDGVIDGKMVEFFPKEAVRYDNGRFEAGFLRGMGEDNFYLKFVRRDGVDEMCIAMRADESLAIINALSAALLVAAKADVKQTRKNA